MVVNEDDVMNIMGGMENAGGIKLNDHKRKLKNRFEISRKLGQGTYGKVQLGINKETGQEVAIKTIKKSKIETEADLIRIRREIQIMSSVQHPNIIHIYEVFENKEKMVLVMEIAAGGELYDYLSDRKCLDDKEARRVFRQIAMATYYCHKHNICHRDLKLENILLDENGGAKIADFGLSNVYDGKNLLNTFCGSPLYASPEIVRGLPYVGPEVDCWSLGVLLYTLVYGAMPFDGSNFKRLVKQITTGDYYEPKNPASASGLIRTMLTVNPDKRANIADICAHSWVNEGYKETCLKEAEHLACLTPVRLELLLCLAPPSGKEEAVVQQEEEEEDPPNIPQTRKDNDSAMCIEELPPDSQIPNNIEDEHSEISISEPPEESRTGGAKAKRQKEKTKRKLKETPSTLDPSLITKNKRESEEVEKPEPVEKMDISHDHDTVAQEPESTSGARASPNTGVRDKIVVPRPRKKKESSERSKDGSMAPTPPVRSSAPKDGKPPPSNLANEDGTTHGSMARRPSPKKARKPKSSEAARESPVMLERPNTPRGRAPSPEMEDTLAKIESLVNPPPPPKISESPVHSKSIVSEPVAPTDPDLTNGANSMSDGHDLTPPSPKITKKESSGGSNTSHIPNQSISSSNSAQGQAPSPVMNGIPDAVLPQKSAESIQEHHLDPFLVNAQHSSEKSKPPEHPKLTLNMGLSTKSNESSPVQSSETPSKVNHHTSPPLVVTENGSPTRPDGDQRGLINSVPKPYVVIDSPKVLDTPAEQPPNFHGNSQSLEDGIIPIDRQKSSNSVASAISLSSSGSNHSVPAANTPNGTDIKIPNPAIPENRDSKVIKAAAFWNNYIGEVISKAKPPDREVVKTMEKPKKIVSAGVGSRGLHDLKNRYENPKPKKIEDEKLAINRRNSKKLNLEGCSPGLKVTDAKSVFETKSQPPPTPSLFRRNSVNSNSSTNGGLGSKWKPKRESGESLEGSPLPFGTNQNHTSPKTKKASVSPQKEKKNANVNPLNIPSQMNKPKAHTASGAKSAPIPTVVPKANLNHLLEPKDIMIPKHSSESETNATNKRNSTIEEASNIESAMLTKVNETLSPGSQRSRPCSPMERKPATSPKPKIKMAALAASKKELNETTLTPEIVSKREDPTEKEGDIMFVGQTSHVEVRPNLNPELLKRSLGLDTKVENQASEVLASSSKQESFEDGSSVIEPDLERESKLAKVGIMTQEIVKPNPTKYRKTVPKKTEETFVTRISMADGIKSVSSPGSPASLVVSPTQRSPPIVSLPVVKISFKPDQEREPGATTLEATPKEAQHVQEPSLASTQFIDKAPHSPNPPIPPPTAPRPEVRKMPYEETVIKSGLPKIKTIEPEMKPGDTENKLEAVKSSLKKIPHAPAMSKKSPEEDEGMTLDLVISPPLERKNREARERSVPKETKAKHALPWQCDKVENPATPATRSVSMDGSVAQSDTPAPKSPAVWSPKSETPVKTYSAPADPSTSSPHPTERIIPIKVHSSVSRSDSSKPPKSHFVPIKIEGKGTVLNKPQHSTSLEDQDEALESQDQFLGGLSRNRWSSKKKRISSAYSDSSMSDDDSSFGMVPMSGLQKYSSLGKHGPFGEDFKLRRTRPPFAMQRAESFSSEGEDDFDDDGMREITAENLFSTLLNRVKSLTKRIHDEHDQHLSWQQTNQRIMNQSLNPGRTHARLERSALRNSQKRSGASTPVNFSRQSSIRDDGTSSLRSYDSSMTGGGVPLESTSGNSSTLGSAGRNFYRGSGATVPAPIPAHRGGSVTPTPEVGGDPYSPPQPKSERKRLEHLHRQFSSELQDLEQDILQASLNKLKREANERSGDMSEISDGYISPHEDTESINSDIFGIPDPVRDYDDRSTSERFRKKSRGLSRLDENSELTSMPSSHSVISPNGTRARPVARRSISRELFEEHPKTSPSSARPVARRSISRELFDPAGPLSKTNPRTRRDDMEAFKQQIRARERSMTRELDAFAADMGFIPPSAMMNQDRNRSASLSRQSLADRLREESSYRLPTRPGLTSHGRSLTHNDFGPSGALDEGSFPRRRTSITGGGPVGGRLPGLEERGRSDWRRISVPERGQDFKSLPRHFDRSELQHSKTPSSLDPNVPGFLTHPHRPFHGSSINLSSYSSAPPSRSWNLPTSASSSSSSYSPYVPTTPTLSQPSPFVDAYATMRRRPSVSRQERARSSAFN